MILPKGTRAVGAAHSIGGKNESPHCSVPALQGTGTRTAQPLLPLLLPLTGPRQVSPIPRSAPQSRRHVIPARVAVQAGPVVAADSTSRNANALARLRVVAGETRGAEHDDVSQGVAVAGGRLVRLERSGVAGALSRPPPLLVFLVGPGLMPMLVGERDRPTDRKVLDSSAHGLSEVEVEKCSSLLSSLYYTVIIRIGIAGATETW